MRTARIIAALSGAALLLVVLAASPAGGAARRSIAAFARNAGAVNGIKASRTPKPGRLVPLGQEREAPELRRSDRPRRPRPPGAAGPGRPCWAQRSDRPGRPRRPGRIEDRLRRPGEHADGHDPHLRRADPPSRVLLGRRHDRRRAVDARQRPPARGRRRRHGRVLPRGRRPRCRLRLRRPRLGRRRRGGTIVYRTPTGTGTVSVSFLGEEYSIAGVARCQFAGTAVAAQ